MAKYWGKQNFSLGSFPEVGQKQKTEEKKRHKKINYGNNNDHLSIANATSGGAHKAAWANTMCFIKKGLLDFFKEAIEMTI